MPLSLIDARDEMDIGDAIGDRDEPEAVDEMDYDAGNWGRHQASPL